MDKQETKGRFKRVNVFLEADVYDAFRAYADKEDASVSQLLRKAMRELLLKRDMENTLNETTIKNTRYVQQ